MLDLGSTNPPNPPIKALAPRPAIFKPVKAANTDKNDFNAPLPKLNTSIILLVIFKNPVKPSTAPLIIVLFAMPIVNNSQALCNLFNLNSNDSAVLPNCSSDAPALLLAASINCIVRS